MLKLRRGVLGSTLVGAAALGLATSASADGIYRGGLKDYAPFSWTGFYLGANAGAAWTKTTSHWDLLALPPFTQEFPQSHKLDSSGFIGGIHGGYNWQVDRSWLLGLEADFSWTNAGTSVTQPWVLFPSGVVRPNTSTRTGLDLNSVSTVRGRLGVLLSPTTLAYFTGGFAWGNVDYSARANNEPPVNYIATTSSSKTVGGYVLGGGMERALTGNWLLRGEYLFEHLNTGRSVTAPDSLNNFPTVPSRFGWSDTDVHTLRAGLSYRF